MNQTPASCTLTAREVYQVLKDLAMGERLLNGVQADAAGLIVDIDGWTLTLGHDGKHLERCETCTAADGRTATQQDWPRYGTDPVSFLSVWERTQLERMLDLGGGPINPVAIEI